MKLKNIILGLAGILAFAACATDTYYAENPIVVVERSSFVLETTAAGETTLTFTSSLPWYIEVTPANATSSVADIKVSPSSGPASLQPVTVSITYKANKILKRDAVISIITKAVGASVRFSQPGDEDPKEIKGSLETPYKPMDIVKDYNSGAVSKGDVLYVRGIVYKLVDISPKKEDGSGYGNATFWISDDGTAPDEDTDAFEVYRALDYGLVDITSEIPNVGDVVTVYGPVTNYNKTVETEQKKAQILAVNGLGTAFGEGTADSPYNVGKAMAEIEKTGATATGEVFVKGVIAKIKEVSPSYGNATYYITDDGYMPEGKDESYLQVFRGKWFGGENFTSENQIKVGDEVVVKGTLVKYNDKTPEVNQGNEIVLLNGTKPNNQ